MALVDGGSQVANVHGVHWLDWRHCRLRQLNLVGATCLRRKPEEESQRSVNSQSSKFVNAARGQQLVCSCVTRCAVDVHKDTSVFVHQLVAVMPQCLLQLPLPFPYSEHLTNESLSFSIKLSTEHKRYMTKAIAIGTSPHPHVQMAYLRRCGGTCTDCEQSLEAAGVSSLSVTGAPLSAPELGAIAPAFTSAAASSQSFSMGDRGLWLAGPGTALMTSCHQVRIDRETTRDCVTDCLWRTATGCLPKERGTAGSGRADRGKKCDLRVRSLTITAAALAV